MTFVYFSFGCTGLSLVWVSRGYSLAAGHGLLTVVASLVAEHKALGYAGSGVVAHGLSCSAACRLFLEQGSNLCHLYWQADS